MGEYQSYAALAVAIQQGLAAVFDEPAVAYNATTRRLVINTGANMADGITAVDAAGFFVCYHDRVGPLAPPLHPHEQYSDVHELLGARPTTHVDLLVNAFGDSVGPGEHASVTPPVLSTTEAIIIRSSLQTSAFQTTNFEPYLPESNMLMHTNIFARIPIMGGHESEMDYIRFHDSNDTFSLYPGTHHLDGLSFYLTDDKGRLLSALAPGVVIPFHLTLKWEALLPDPQERPALGPGISAHYFRDATRDAS